MEDISKDPYYENPDVGIMVNLGFCLVVSLPLFVAFCVLRKRIFRLYDANLVYRDRSKLPGLSNGTFSWIVPTLFLKDKHLLLLVGLDGFVYLKSLKLMFIIMIFFGLTGMLVSWPVYYFNHKSSANYYVRSCIRNIKTEAFLWVPFFTIVACTVFLFYSVYLYYRNLVVYRQAYLKSPSTFQALNKIETYSGRLRSYGETVKFFDVLNRSVIVSGISSTYSIERIEAIFEDMRLGDIQSVFIAKDRSLIMRQLNKVNSMHQKLEKAYNKLFLTLYKAALKDTPDLADQLSQLGLDGLHAAQAMHLRDLFNSPKFYTKFRDTTKTEDGEKVDAIELLASELEEANEELNAMVYHYINETDSSLCTPVPFTEGNGFADDPEVFHSLSDLVSFRALMGIRQNVNDFKLTLWGTSSSAVIIFNDWKSAAIASQALLSARPFSFAVEPAPMVTEVDWDNLYMPRADRSLRNVLGVLLYIILNIFFSIFVAMFVSLMDLQVLEKALPFLGPLLERFPKLRDMIIGVLGPLALNIIFAVIPYLLVVLTYYQAYVDKAEVQLAIMNKYSWLLLLQTFIVALAGPVQDIFQAIYARNYDSLLKKLDQKAALSSAIFLNLTLQKALIGLVMVLTKPAGIFLALVERIRHREVTPRDKRELNKPSSLPLGFLYPEYAVIVFQMCLSFGFITPVILVTGVLFFGLAYFVFRAQLIFSNKIPHETGGLYWPSMSTHIIFALVMAQFFTLIQFISLNGKIQAFLLGTVIGCTLLGMIGIRRRFHRRVCHIALSGEAQEASHRLIQEQNELREEVIDRAYVEPSGSVPASVEPTEAEILRSVRTFDTFNVNFELEDDELEPDDLHVDGVSSASQSEIMSNPYTNPVVLKRLRTLMLPLHFFALIQWLQEHPIPDIPDT